MSPWEPGHHPTQSWGSQGMRAQGQKPMSFPLNIPGYPHPPPSPGQSQRGVVTWLQTERKPSRLLVPKLFLLLLHRPLARSLPKKHQKKGAGLYTRSYSDGENQPNTTQSSIFEKKKKRRQRNKTKQKTKTEPQNCERNPFPEARPSSLFSLQQPDSELSWAVMEVQARKGSVGTQMQMRVGKRWGMSQKCTKWGWRRRQGWG